MRRRRVLWIAFVVAGGAACGSAKPHGDGTARVTVVDDLGTGIAGVPVFSTARGRVIGRAVTGVLGTANLAVVTGGEVTAAMERSTSDRILTTVEGVHPGPVELPMELVVPGGVGVSVLVLGTTGTYADVIAGRCEVSVPVTGAAASLTLARSCTHGDGTFSVSAQKAIIVVSGMGDPTGYAVDVPIGQVGVVSLGVSTAATVTQVPWTVANIPANRDGAVTHWPSHRGLRLGPPTYDYFHVPSGSASGSFGVWSTSLADGSELDVDLYDVTDSGRWSGLRLRQSGSGPIDVDASALPPFVGATFDSGSAAFVFTDPATSVRDTRLFVSWQDANAVVHGWTVYAPPPVAAGARKIPLPPVPSDLASFATDLSAPMSLYDVCAGYLGPARPEFQADPDPDLPAGDGSVSYSKVCRLY